MRDACADRVELLARRLDDATAGGQALEAHLASCAACAAALESHRKIQLTLAATRPAVPAGLAARLARRALDPVAQRVIFWRDVEVSARVALRAAVVLLVSSTALAAIVSYSSPRERDVATLDEVAGLAIAPTSDALDQLLQNEESR